MMTSFYNLLKYAATGQASPDMTYYDKARASTLMGGVVQTLTGQPPLSFSSDGSPLISWSMKGNGSQQGTPTPDNPVMPTFCGVRTGNLLNLPTQTIAKNGVTVSVSGSTITMSGASYGETSSADAVWESLSFTLPAGTYSLNRIESGHGVSRFVRANGAQILGATATTFTLTEETTCNIGFYIYRKADEVLTTNYMLNLGNTALPYEPFGYKIPISCGGENFLDESASSDADATHINYNKNSPVILTAGQTYTFSCDTTCNGLYIRNVTDDSSLASANNSSTLTYTPQVNVSAYFRVWNSNGITNLKPMLNLGSTPKPYAPYSRQTNTVYLGNTQTVRKIVKEEILPSSIVGYEDRTDFVIVKTRIVDLKTAENKLNYLSSHFKVKGTGDSFTAGVLNNNYNNFYNMEFGLPTTITSLDDAKAWFNSQKEAGHPVTIWYVLAESTTGIVNEPLAKIGTYADELSSTDAGVTIPTAKGQNTLTVETELQPSEMTITYKG